MSKSRITQVAEILKISCPPAGENVSVLAELKAADFQQTAKGGWKLVPFESAPMDVPWDSKNEMSWRKDALAPYTTAIKEAVAEASKNW